VLFFRREKPVSREVGILMRVPLFSCLSRKELEVIAAILHERSYIAREIIFDEGDEGLGMYIIVEGKVKIYKKTLLNKKELAIMGANDTFGELALLDGAPRAASAVAEEPGIVFGFFRPEFLEIMESHHRIGMRLSFALACETANRLRASLGRDAAYASL